VKFTFVVLYVISTIKLFTQAHKYTSTHVHWCNTIGWQEGSTERLN